MKCRCCGSQMDNSETRCSYCGTMVEGTNPIAPEQEYTSSYYNNSTQNSQSNQHGTTQPYNYQPYTYQPYKYEPPASSYHQQTTNYQPRSNGKSSGDLAFLMGILSLVFGTSGFGFIFALIAITNGIKAKKSGDGYESRRGTTGMILGIFSLFVEVFFVVLLIIASFASSYA